MTDQTNIISEFLNASAVHKDWRQPLTSALNTVDKKYLLSLIQEPDWLPGKNRLLAAFRDSPELCRYILFGESPYPRSESANGMAFYDANVEELWSDKGLSKAINRATSLRNILKAMLLAQNLITPDSDQKITQPMISAVDKSSLIQNIHELFNRLQQKGFLLMNATPVLHPARKPQQEAKYWILFVEQLLLEISTSFQIRPTLVLWGKIAQQVENLPISRQFPQLISEHPYNISFIQNPQMQNLFAELQILDKAEEQS